MGAGRHPPPCPQGTTSPLVQPDVHGALRQDSQMSHKTPPGASAGRSQQFYITGHFASQQVITFTSTRCPASRHLKCTNPAFAPIPPLKTN